MPSVSFHARELVIIDSMQVGILVPADHDDDGDPIAWNFEAIASIEFTASELRAIADRLDELNQVKHEPT